MNGIKRIHKRKNASAIWLKFLLLLITIMFVVGVVDFQIQIHTLRKRKEELSTMIDAQMQKKEEYLKELEAVGSDEYYEYMARKNLGYIYPDEKYLVMVDENGDIIQ